MKQNKITNTKSNTVTIATITLPIRSLDVDAENFVPQKMEYGNNKELLKLLAQKGAIEARPILLIGEAGVGKTSAIRHLAGQTNTPLRNVSLNGSMTAEDFLGQVLIKDGSTYWRDGVLTECMRKGYWLNIDELNFAGPEILQAMQTLVAGREQLGYVVLTDSPTKELVTPHPDFRIFATMNPVERYHGTQELNRAFAGRWLKAEVAIPSADVEYGVISRAIEVLPESTLAQLKAYVSELRKSYDKEELDVFVSPRDVASIVDMYAFTKDMLQAIAYTIQPLATTADKKAIGDLARLHFLAPATLATEPIIVVAREVDASGNTI